MSGFTRLVIGNNNQLTNVNGLENYSDVLFELNIFDNPLLTNLDGLSGLTSLFIGPDSTTISLTNNTSLSSIFGLSNIPGNTIDEITITGNTSLSNCSITSFCDFLDLNPGTGATINNNATGCNSRPEIEANCLACPDAPLTLTSQADVDNFAANFPGCDTLNFDLTISGNDITDLSGLSQITNIAARLIIVNNVNLTTLNGLGSIDFPSNNASIEIEDNPLLTSVGDFTPSSASTIAIILKNNPLLASINTFGGINSLGALEIENNDSLINLSGLEGLLLCDVLFVINNDLLQDISALGNISGFASNIDISGNPALTSLTGLDGYTDLGIDLVVFDNDALTDLNGLSGLNNLNTLPNSVFYVISDNAILSDITGLENIDVGSLLDIEITDNPSLSVCANISICEYLDNGGNALIQNNAPGCNSTTEVLDSCSLLFNRISGTIQFDFDANGCDPGDFDASNILVEISDGMNDYSTLTDANGNYDRFLDVDGNITTSVAPGSLPMFFSADPASVNTTFTGFGNEEVIDFCISASQVIDDLKIVQIPLNDARPGFDADYELVYENLGTTLQTDQVVLTFPDTRMSFVSANPAPDNVTSNQLSWNYTNLLPFESRSITLTFSMFTPPTNQAGDILEFTAEVFPISGDANEADNTYNLDQIVVNSQDPNDKLVLQGEEIFEDQVGEYLDYIVRFQNVGTADAINVRVEDELSDNLDWNSLRILSASHDFELEILNGNFLSFIFDDINLPPVTIDPEGSNGYVAFQVRSLNTLVLGDQIENSANIFFDFNDPIITNTVVTEVVEELSVPEYDLANSINVYPNPVSDLLTIKLSNGIKLQSVEVYSILGNRLMEAYETTIDVSSLSEAMYFIKVSTDKGVLSKKIIKL